MSDPFMPTKLFVGDNDNDTFDVRVFSMEIHRQVADDGTVVGANRGGLLNCQIALEKEGLHDNFFASWLADPSKRQNVIFEFFRLSNSTHYQTVRILNAALVGYNLRRVKDDDSTALVSLVFGGPSVEVGENIIDLTQ